MGVIVGARPWNVQGGTEASLLSGQATPTLSSHNYMGKKAVMWHFLFELHRRDGEPGTFMSRDETHCKNTN